jgi:hypothetical protein
MTEKAIDFYNHDSEDIPNFEPIFRNLKNAAMVAHRVRDVDRATAYFNERGLPFQNKPRINPACTVTTQSHWSIEIPEYNQSISMRLMYSISEKNLEHQYHWNQGFDAILVPGKYSQRLLEKYFHTIIVGLPKYDSLFRGELRKEELSQLFNLDKNKKTILYLPTWGPLSSIDLYQKEIKQVSNENKYNFIFKPHSVTVSNEQHRIGYFRKEINESKMVCLEQQMNLDKLFAVADIVMADAASGAFWDSVIIANLPTLAISIKGNFKKKNLDTKVHKFAIVNSSPNSLMENLNKVENEPSQFKAERKELADELISYRDGTASKRAADAILKFLESGKPKKDRKKWLNQIIAEARCTTGNYLITKGILKKKSS